MRAFTIVIIFIAVCHIYFSLTKGNSPLSWEFLALLISPLFFIAWKDIQNIKLGKDGLEFEKTKNVNEYISRAVHGKHLGKIELDSIFESVKANEWATLIMSRMLMRKGLMAFSPSNHGFGDSPSLQKLIELNRSNGRISASEADELERLREITFFAEWWSGRAPTHRDWNWAIQNCKRLVEQLFEKQEIA